MNSSAPSPEPEALTPAQVAEYVLIILSLIGGCAGSLWVCLRSLKNGECDCFGHTLFSFRVRREEAPIDVDAAVALGQATTGNLAVSARSVLGAVVTALQTVNGTSNGNLQDAQATFQATTAAHREFVGQSPMSSTETDLSGTFGRLTRARHADHRLAVGISLPGTTSSDSGSYSDSDDPPTPRGLRPDNTQSELMQVLRSGKGEFKGRSRRPRRAAPVTETSKE